MVTDTIKVALWEELRFVKRQQWTITAAVVVLMAGAYSITRSLVGWEKSVITILIVASAIGGIYWLFDLQRHLRRTRLVIGPYDRGHRGLDIVYGMVITLIISAVAVCYLSWRDFIIDPPR